MSKQKQTSKWKSRRNTRKDCLPKLKSVRSQEMQSPPPTPRNALTICVWFTCVHMYVEVRDQHWVSSITPHLTFWDKVTCSPPVGQDGWPVSLRGSPISIHLSTGVLIARHCAQLPPHPTPPHRGHGSKLRSPPWEACASSSEHLPSLRSLL